LKQILYFVYGTFFGYKKSKFLTLKMAVAKTINILIGGEAGAGVHLSARIFANLCLEAGWQVFVNNEYPSLIRGGHNFSTVRASEGEVFGHSEKYNLVLALNTESVKLHQNEIVSGGKIIFDEKNDEKVVRRGSLKYFAVPLEQLALEKGGSLIFVNTVGMGAICALEGFMQEMFLKVLKKYFGGKGSAVLNKNLAAGKAGYEYIQKYFPEKRGVKQKYFQKNFIAAGKKKSRSLLSGNELIAEGAMAGGIKFFAGYPMTPVTGIMETLQKKPGLIVKQTEDEIAAINQAIGASWAGVKAMVATSGGGFCLMTEALGFAGMTGIPLVIVEGQRVGPSTGMPTMTEQGDLLFVIHASQGEFPRVVLTPGDHNEMRACAENAFAIANYYRLPVIILVDKFLTDSLAGVDQSLFTSRLSAGKKTALLIKPGTRGKTYRNSSYEHDGNGVNTDDPEMRVKMMKKRMDKLSGKLPLIPAPKLHGPKKAGITFVAWGSTKGAIMETLELLKKDGLAANFLQIKTFVPWHGEEILKILKNAKKVIGVEMNYSGQMCEYIASKTGFLINNKILKYSGRQITAEEIYEKTGKIINKNQKD
jgi:2-oxoglutarate/2-oxoacid ferredoxin oxidoreductase subunit alpha